jgi:hypothetical protein
VKRVKVEKIVRGGEASSSDLQMKKNGDVFFLTPPLIYFSLLSLLCGGNGRVRVGRWAFLCN